MNGQADRIWPHMRAASRSRFAPRIGQHRGRRAARGLEAAWQSYALRACSRALLASSNPLFPLGSAGAAGGDRGLLMAVRGHVGDTPRLPDPTVLAAALALPRAERPADPRIRAALTALRDALHATNGGAA